MYLSTKKAPLAVVVAVAAVSLAGQTKCDNETPICNSSPQHLTETEIFSGLSDYLIYAAHNDAGLQAAFNRWQAALERIPQVQSLPDPRFTYSYFIESVETRVGPQRQRFGVSQAFPWFGTLGLRGDIATEEAAAAKQAYEREKRALFSRVTHAYYEYWYLYQSIGVTKEHIRLVTDMEQIARTQLKTGTTPSSAVIQLQVEIGKLDDQLRAQEAMQKPIVAKLNAALNRPIEKPLPWARTLPDRKVSFTDEQAKEWTLANNPDLQMLSHTIEKNKAGIKLAKKSSYPTITLGVDYVQTDDAANPNSPDSGKDPVMAMVALNLPIWHSKNRAAKQEAERMFEATQNENKSTTKRLTAELELALYHFHDAERRIVLYGSTLVPKAEQSLKVTQQDFEAGKASFTSLLNAQRMLLEFQLMQKRAQADRGQHLADIERLTGKQLYAKGAEG
jgi:outer membrane protein TolC